MSAAILGIEMTAIQTVGKLINLEIREWLHAYDSGVVASRLVCDTSLL